MYILTDDGRRLVKKKLSELFAERNKRIRDLNAEYESERRRFEKMLESGFVPQTF